MVKRRPLLCSPNILPVVFLPNPLGKNGRDCPEIHFDILPIFLLTNRVMDTYVPTCWVKVGWVNVWAMFNWAI